MTDVEPWMGEMEAFLIQSPEGYEYKVIARESFKNLYGHIVLDDKEKEGDIVITYNATILEQLMEKGKLSKEIGEPLLKEFHKIEREQDEFMKFLEANPEASNEEKSEAFRKIRVEELEEINKRQMSVRHLLSLQHVIEEERKAAKMPPLFNKHLRPGKDFGVTKAVMDRLVYLPELLEKAKKTRISEDSDHYLISSNLFSSSGDPIGLEYDFLAPNQTASDQIFEIYKKEMDKEALKVLLGFWAVANERGVFDYIADITEVMEKTAAFERESYFSIKEKKRFWSLVKLLEGTRLTLVIPYKSGSKGKTITIPYRLIEISAREESEKSEENEGYPNKIRVRVLNPEDFKEKAQLATAIAAGTLRLPPHDIMLALSIQTRAAQRRAYTESPFDEDRLIERANLAKTKSANPSVARKRLCQKLDNLVEIEVIKDWSKINDRYLILHTPKDEPQDG